MKIIFLALVLLFPFGGFTQPYSVDWYKVAGGGGTSSGGGFQISGTIGQQDAGTALSGGAYSVTGGFWALAAVQTAGAPVLHLTQSGNHVILSWIAPSTGFVLQGNSDLTATNNWLLTGPAPVTTDGFNYVTNTVTPGNKFYRLYHP